MLLKGWMLRHPALIRYCRRERPLRLCCVYRPCNSKGFLLLIRWNFLYFNLCYWEVSASITSFIHIDNIPLEPSAAWTVPALPASLHRRDAPVLWSSLLDLTRVWGAGIFVLKGRPWYKDIYQPEYFGEPKAVFPARSMCNLCKTPLKYGYWIAWLHQLLTDYAQKYVTKMSVKFGTKIFFFLIGG